MSADIDSMFINREEELNTFEAVLAGFLSGDDAPDGPRIFEYVGMVGVGKSTLLAELRSRSESYGLRTFSIDFALRRQNEPISFFVLDTLISLLTLREALQSPEYVTLVSALNAYNSSEVSRSDEHMAAVFARLAELVGKTKSVLLCDSAEHVPTEFLEWLFSHFLQELGNSQNTLVFIASRRELDWGRYNYRIKRRYLRLQRLNAFSIETTALQIETAGGDPALVTHIHRLGAGNGVATIHLLRAIEQLNARVDARNFGDFERRLVNVLHQEFVEKKIRIPAELMRAFQVTSVLRQFDIDLPSQFLQHIRPGEWRPADWRQLLDRMRAEPMDELVVVSEDPDAGYSIAQPVRTILALRLRFDEQDTYSILSRSAVEYYERRLRTEGRLAHIRQKLFHLADLYRLDTPPRYDVEIAKELQSVVRQDLQAAFPEVYASADGGKIPRFEWSKAARIDQMRRLQLSLRKDVELREKLGDIATAPLLIPEDIPTIFDPVIENIIERSESPTRLTLSILKVEDPTLTRTEASTYLVSLNRGEQPIGLAQRTQFSRNLKKRLYEKLEATQTPLSLEGLGKALYANALPLEVQDFLRVNDSPTAITTDDVTIPWEIMHDGNDFISLKVSVGKIPIFGGNTRIPLASPKARIRVLVVGVSEPRIPGIELRHLEAVETEVQLLSDMFSESARIDFEYSRDVLLDESALEWDLSEKLNTGQYDIVHFAGHTYYEGRDSEESDTGLSHGAGIALCDGVLAFDKMPQLLLRASPFVFLNTCKSEGLIVERKRYETVMEGGAGFLRGGAVGCVVTTQGVDDKAAPIFAQRFYSFLLEARSIGDALRLAKRETRQIQPESTNWASYVLLGYPDYRLFVGQ